MPYNNYISGIFKDKLVMSVGINSFQFSSVKFLNKARRRSYDGEGAVMFPCGAMGIFLLFSGLCALFLSVPDAACAQGSGDALSVVTEGGQHLIARQKAVKRMGRNLDKDSIAELYDFMDRKTDPGLHRDELLAIKDAVCSLLDSQEKYPAELPERLIAMYNDKTHDIRWRDYCVQHLNKGYALAAPEMREAIRNTFWKATGQIDSTIAGTALIALYDNSSSPAIDKAAVAAKALEIVANPASGNPAKITALQICAQLDVTDAIGHARKLVETAGERPLRMSAIAAIGRLGDNSDRPLLARYAKGADRVVSISAKAALKRLNSKDRKRVGNF